jgi:quercetin dioxygenase-like cupin family protein
MIMSKKAKFGAALATVALCAWVVASIPGVARAAKSKTKAQREVVLPADQMHFKEAMQGVSRAVLWGNPDKGPYASITRFSKGFKVGRHYHSHNIKAVIISGTFVYDSGNGEKRLGPGSYLFEPRGLRHSSAAGGDEDCVFLEQGDGPFDLKMAK